MAGIERKRILITVRTYPVPSEKSIEVSCTAGITEDGKWIRLFPMPYRLLEENKKFKKYQWVTVGLRKAERDPRPESYNPQVEDIVVGDELSSEREWRARWEKVRPLMRTSMCEIQKTRDEKGSPTLGIFKPAKIRRLIIAESAADWTQAQKNALSQSSIFVKAPEQKLEKIPYDFSYEYTCSDPECSGHRMICTDWEIDEAYRQWRRKYRKDWERYFREKFERDMIEKFDTHFYVGNLHQYPGSWIIVGLFYPPKPTTSDLFG